MKAPPCDIVCQGGGVFPSDGVQQLNHLHQGGIGWERPIRGEEA